MASNGFQTSYANDRPPSSAGSGGEADLASDPASSGFFINDYKKHEDLKQMLDGNKDNMKLEAMKRIIGMVAKGKDASDLFPAVVKNVVSKNIEVKKLVYVYLTRYAEEQQDLALLSISTFQRALKDPNQLIRASALRVLSSIRVPMIVPIMQLSVKEGVNDMSPYVRKTAAHAIPKLYSLDPEQKDILIEVIEKLLADKTTLVAGSAIQAFEEVCPERIDLIHKNYRKLCNLLVDVDEWGQVAIINMLTRYCRTQFINPNYAEGGMDGKEQDFYASSGDSDDEEEEEEAGGAGGDVKPKKKPYEMDIDHRLLLKTCKPLLNSRNGSVVMAVAQLYHHCAPVSEVGLVAKALIRLLRGHKEVQYVVLSNIASMSVKRKSGDRYAGMFEPFLKSFYVRSNDPTHVKLLKLEILTNLATESNISTILREFQTYVTSSDQDFAAATIQAIGRCASNIAEITDACLNGLCSLLTNRNETVVGESVVVIKKLLQMQPTEYKEIIQHLARLADTIQVPMARASILWLIGEYSDRVPKIAPDVLRKMAKTFINEEDIVKLQILNLAGKLCLTNAKQTKLLCQYVFNLAKYDQNYDIRDRARFLRQLILPPAATGGSGGDKAGNQLAKHAKKIFLATKPAPVLESQFKDRDQYQLGTLSHLLNSKAHGYQELPDWPENAPDSSVRNVEVATPWTETYKAGGAKAAASKHDKKKGFYSENESSSCDESSESGSSSGSGSDSGSEEKSGSASESESQSESESESEEEEKPKPKAKAKKQELLLTTEEEAKQEKEEESSEEEEESSSEGSSSSEEEESEEEQAPPPPKAKAHTKTGPKRNSKEPPAKPSSLLLDLDDFGPPPSGAVMNLSNMLAPMTGPAAAPAKPKVDYSNIMGGTTSAASVPQKSRELLNRMSGQGLSITYRFTRTVSIFSPKMVSVELTFTNHSDAPIENIKLADSNLPSGAQVEGFPEVTSLAAGANISPVMSINFNDSTQPAQLTLSSKSAKYPTVSLAAPVGELLIPNTLTEADFIVLQGKLSGMNENTGKVDIPSKTDITTKVLSVANVLQVSRDESVYRFASKTVSDGTDALISLKVTDNKANITVNCEKMVIGSMLLKDLKRSLSTS